MIPESRRSSGGGNGTPLQYSYLENSIVREAYGGLSSMGLQRARHDWASEHNVFIIRLGVPYLQVCFESETESHSVMSNSLWPHRLYSLWDSLRQNTGVASYSFLQGIFPTQGLNPGLPHCRQILYQWSCQGSPRIQEWVICLFSSGST